MTSIACTRGLWLQWGRRLLATESREVCLRCPWLSSASMGPSPVGDGERIDAATSTTCPALQWGRRLLATESAVLDDELRDVFGGFNGAVACWRRRVQFVV